MYGGEVLGRAGRQGAVELGQGAGGGQGLGALDQVAFELAAQVALEPGQLGAVDRRQLLAVLARRLLAGGEAERAADPLHVDPDHARALAAAEGGDRQPRQVAQPVLVAGRHRLADLLAQLVDVDPLALAALALARPSLALGDRRAGPPRPRRRGRSSDRRAARRRGGRPGTWRSSPPAPRGSRRARSTRPARGPRRRRGSPRCRPRPPRRAAPRRSRAASPPSRAGPGRPLARRAWRHSLAR